MPLDDQGGSNRPPLAIPHWLAVEMGREAFEALCDQARATVEAETSKTRAWQPLLDRDIIELRPC